MEIIFGFVLIVLGFMFYFMPAFIANNKENGNWIFLFNLFLGWTFLGWIAALIWAIITPQKQAKMAKY